MKFLFFLLCFLVARFAGANPPSFLMPEYVNPWRDQYDSLTQAFEDALILARTVATTFDATKTCDIVSAGSGPRRSDLSIQHVAAMYTWLGDCEKVGRKQLLMVMVVVFESLLSPR